MSRWPPILWITISAASLLVLVGYDGADYHPVAFFAGAGLAILGFALALWLAFGRRDRPRPAGLAWLLPAAAVFYVVCAVVAATAGPAYAVAALAAGVIPATAAALLIATARTKTAGDDEHPRDLASSATDAPLPGIGIDSETPLGDTPEHSDAERVARPDPRLERRSRSRR
jgi:peptidoglycan/LPS O-acetylase OafA/YrhL